MITPLLKGRLSVFKFSAKMHFCVKIAKNVITGLAGIGLPGNLQKSKCSDGTPQEVVWQCSIRAYRFLQVGGHPVSGKILACGRRGKSTNLFVNFSSNCAPWRPPCAPWRPPGSGAGVGRPGDFPLRIFSLPGFLLSGFPSQIFLVCRGFSSRERGGGHTQTYGK